MIHKTVFVFRTILVTVILNIYVQVSGQGCSDAGICSAGGMLPGKGKMEKGSITLNTQYGLGEQNVQIITPQLEVVKSLNSKNAVQVKLPYIFTDGNVGTNRGFGDIIAVLSHHFYDTNQRKLSLNAGVRIGVNSANRVSSKPVLSGPISLPMPYQTSLGTHDLLIGLDYQLKNQWGFALGAQVPFYQFNRNNFDTSKLLQTETAGKQYFSSDHLIRSPDIVLRVDRMFNVNEKWSFTGGLLLIYHVLHDKAINSTGNESAIHGSKGATLNVPLATRYQFNKAFSCTVRFASPVIVRNVRPDGLTRHYAVGLELMVSF